MTHICSLFKFTGGGATVFACVEKKIGNICSLTISSRSGMENSLCLIKLNKMKHLESKCVSWSYFSVCVVA